MRREIGFQTFPLLRRSAFAQLRRGGSEGAELGPEEHALGDESQAVPSDVEYVLVKSPTVL